jgi:hypothetical protein
MTAANTDTLAQLRAGKLAGATRLKLCESLKEFPREIFDLADSLEHLDLGGNQLDALPSDLGRLGKLRVFFASYNRFTKLPAALGDCTGLEIIGLRANRIAELDAAALPRSLVTLILTENRLQTLPASIARCAALRKIMLSGNQITRLPEELAACEQLEMLRLAANHLTTMPGWLLSLPRLCWLAIAGNPCTSRGITSPSAMPGIPWASLRLQEKLGEGASGAIYRALLDGSGPVALKLFKSGVTSDGLPRSEMAASLVAGGHGNLIPVLGRLMDHPSGTEGLIMALLEPGCRPLAAPPTLESCTRDVHPTDPRFSSETARGILHGVASAARHLHGRGILHGDLYAHNVLWRPEGRAYLSDFGAASVYPHGDQRLARELEAVEARAFGLLLEEMLPRTEWPPSKWRDLSSRCLSPGLQDRPSFDEIAHELS